MTTPRELADRLGRWLSAALDDPQVCDEMKADIEAWFDAGQPSLADQQDQNAKDAWQPIETAPNDGTRVIVWHEHFTAPCSARYYSPSSEWMMYYGGSSFKRQPTHWMPLPAPPGAARTQEPKT